MFDGTMLVRGIWIKKNSSVTWHALRVIPAKAGIQVFEISHHEGHEEL